MTESSWKSQALTRRAWVALMRAVIRGEAVTCAHWQTFRNFVEDVGERPLGRRLQC